MMAVVQLLPYFGDFKYSMIYMQTILCTITEVGYFGLSSRLALQ